jgi:hypothetical protein
MTALGFYRQAFPSALQGKPSLRPRLALPLSIALHVALLFAVSRMYWHPEPALPGRPHFVWLSTPLLSPAEPQPEGSVPANVAPIVRAPAPDVSIAEPPPAPAERARRQRPGPSKPEIGRVVPQPHDTAAAPATATRPPRSLPSGIDWAKERQRAAVGVVEQRQLDKSARTFSPEDLLPPEAPPQDAPLVVVPTDHCAVVSGKLERFAMQMLGRCVRDADGNMFAAIKPDYLKSHPVCAVVADAPATFLDARGHEYSTAKCRLVLDE